MGLFRALLSIVLSIGLPLAVQLWDRAQMPPAARGRVWNQASWGAAVYGLGPLSMLGWGWVTRRSLAGLLLGAAHATAMVAVMVLVDAILAALAD